MPDEPTSDVNVLNYGSICLVHLLTPAAEEWVKCCIDEDAQSWGRALVVEPRYLEALLDGMLSDGISVRVDGQQLPFFGEK